MASNMFLYWGSGSVPCWRAMLVLEEKGLQGYGNKLLSFSKKEHKGEEVLKLNPRGQVRVTRPVQSAAVIYVRSLPKFGGGERVGWGCRGSCCLYTQCQSWRASWTLSKRMLYVIVRPCFSPDRQQAGLTLSQSSGGKKTALSSWFSYFLILKSLGIACFCLKSAWRQSCQPTAGNRDREF